MAAFANWMLESCRSASGSILPGGDAPDLGHSIGQSLSTKGRNRSSKR